MTEVRITPKANGDIPAVSISEKVDLDPVRRFIDAQVFEPGRSLMISSNCAGVATSLRITFDEARALAAWLTDVTS